MVMTERHEDPTFSFTICISDEELKNYFSAPLTHPPTKGSSPVHHHLVIIEEEL